MIEQYGAVTVLRGSNSGAYPHGNSLLIAGCDSSLLVDPSLGLGQVDSIDAVLLSHGHEDHTAGLGTYPVEVHAHEQDVEGVRDVDLMFGKESSGTPYADFLESAIEEFELTSRPDAIGFADGATFDLGNCTVTAVHLPGHTAGHCGFLVEPDGFFYVADIDLTSFGPYYGDPGSSLTAFEGSLQRCREIDARWYGTFHQKGVIDGADEFRRRLDAYRGVITSRDTRLLAYLDEPRTVDDIAAHRLVYRPHVEGTHVDPVERITAQRHLERLTRSGAVEESSPGRYRAT